MSDLSWDDLCVNPHESAIETGRKEGREAGLRAGFTEGVSLGHLKGIEYGMELGFIRGILYNVLDALDSDNETTLDDKVINDRDKERLRKTAQALSRALEEFPTPNNLFEGQTNSTSASMVNAMSLTDDTEKEPENGNGVDFIGKVQRIRAKYKLLMVQLGLPHTSIKHVFEKAKEAAKEGSTNW